LSDDVHGPGLGKFHSRRELGVAKLSSRRADPATIEEKVDIEPVLRLQYQAGVGYAGLVVESDGEIPETHWLVHVAHWNSWREFRPVSRDRII
jgi:hypothetical protein